jgi:hypothetical protein
VPRYGKKCCLRLLIDLHKHTHSTLGVQLLSNKYHPFVPLLSFILDFVMSQVFLKYRACGISTFSKFPFRSAFTVGAVASSSVLIVEPEDVRDF